MLLSDRTCCRMCHMGAPVLHLWVCEWQQRQEPYVYGRSEGVVLHAEANCGFPSCN